MDGKKNLITILVAVVFLGLLILGYFYYQKPKPPVETPEEKKAAESSQKALESATKATLPEIKPLNPLEKLPDINPVGKTNPFKDLYKNPFAK